MEMMDNTWQERTERILGSEALGRLASLHVAVFGLGGVGGHAAISLARCGVGKLTLIDMDTVDETNINRQEVAWISTVGRKKTEVIKEMIADINPACEVNAIDMFYLPENADTVDITLFDHVIDAIDTVSAKLALIERCVHAGTPIVSSMGTGNRTDPTKLRIVDISKTKDDPLARDMRRELKKRNINHLDVCWSEEIPVKTGTFSPGSLPFVPAAAGLALAAFTVKQLLI